MKNLFIFNLSLLILISSCSLKKVTVKDGVTAKLPSNAKPLSTDEKLPGNFYPFQTADKSYMIDGIYVALTKNRDSGIKGIPLESRLSTIIYDKNKLYKVESAKIEIYNGQRYIVVNYLDSLMGSHANEYFFFNDSEHKNNVVVGHIRYNKATQQKEAEKLLKTILTNLKTD